MSQSLSLAIVHVIFSTKNRAPVLKAEMLPDTHAYLAVVARDMNCECYRVGGIADHVHLAIRLSRTLTIAKLVEKLKTASSKWLKAQHSQLQDLSWQHGYGAFSISPTHLNALLHYIDNQEEHHQQQSFQEEFRAFLNKYEIEYDERYVWD